MEWSTNKSTGAIKYDFLHSGNVKMDVSDALSEEEIAKGYILCCQSIPLTDSLVIEIE